ncbi:hypothetical protein AQUCO_07000019v1 [Aquilegia coerulea]|uniref:Uncharacterized protein n=1 Tax=Aquilegia coerulea TaxID=218851 RepID=A0A2G5CAV5_AQUCA|nr:hypothetical protein AQUCO_07000019v1 [Aquilegia coerulea]
MWHLRGGHQTTLPLGLFSKESDCTSNKKTDEIISNSIESELISSNETKIFSEIENSPASTSTLIVGFTTPESVKQSQNVHSDDSSEFFNTTTLNAKMIVDYLRCKKNLDAVMDILIEDCYGEFEGSNGYTELESKKVRIGYFCLFLWIVFVSVVLGL